ncbi:ANTAR domain-containing protein [Streptomyces kanasensis]|uniref:ANTAR domain-containing protein n=1 Tax=Streptomyces kanasensis TaxID=936756 RepID=UPI0038135647
MRRITPRQDDYERVFLAARSPMVLLSPVSTVLDVNPAYLRAVGRERDELVGRSLLDVLPDAVPGTCTDAPPGTSADAPADGDGVRHGPGTDRPDRDRPGRGGSVPAVLGASLRRVLRLHRPDVTPPQRVRVPSTDGPTGRADRYWTFRSSALFDGDGTVTGLLVQVEDVTAGQARGARLPDGPAADRGRLAALETENAQLRTALRSRATIDQAVGIVMAERRVGPDEAFRILVSLSQHTNVKLRDVAAAMVHRTADGGTGGTGRTGGTSGRGGTGRTGGTGATGRAGGTDAVARMTPGRPPVE